MKRTILKNCRSNRSVKRSLEDRWPNYHRLHGATKDLMMVKLCWELTFGNLMQWSKVRGFKSYYWIIRNWKTFFGNSQLIQIPLVTCVKHKTLRLEMTWMKLSSRFLLKVKSTNVLTPSTPLSMKSSKTISFLIMGIQSRRASRVTCSHHT